MPYEMGPRGLHNAVKTAQIAFAEWIAFAAELATGQLTGHPAKQVFLQPR